MSPHLPGRSVRPFLPVAGINSGLGTPMAWATPASASWQWIAPGAGAASSTASWAENTTGETIHCRGPKGCAFEPTNGRPPSWRPYTSGTTGDGEPARCGLLLDSTGYVVNQPVRQISVITIWTAIASPRADAAIGTSTSFASRLMCRRARRYSGRRSAGQRN